MANSLRTSVDVSLTPRQAFDTLVDELTLALNDRRMKFTPSSAGKMLEGDVEVGTIQEWIPGDRISILWHPKTWQAGTTSRLLIKFKAHNEGTSVVVEQDRKSTRLNSSHVSISYAVFCLKKKTISGPQDYVSVMSAVHTALPPN